MRSIALCTWLAAVELVVEQPPDLWRLQLARGFLDDLHLGDVFPVRGAELTESASRYEHARFERRHGSIVGLYGLVEPALYVVVVRRQHEQAIVKLPAELADLLRVGLDSLLSPAIRDGLEQRDQRRRTRQDDAVGDAVFQQ